MRSPLLEMQTHPEPEKEMLKMQNTASKRQDLCKMIFPVHKEFKRFRFAEFLVSNSIYYNPKWV